MSNSNSNSDNIDTQYQNINDLLNKANEMLSCDSACQREKTLSDLKQKYLDAQTNVESAPTQFSQAKQNYYQVLYGNDYSIVMEKELTEQANSIANVLQEAFNTQTNNLLTFINVYKSQLTSYNYVDDLYTKYMSYNSKFDKKIKDTANSIQVNNQKTFYEQQSYNKLRYWFYLYAAIYTSLLLFFLALMMLFPSLHLTRLQCSLIFVGFIIYPFIINGLTRRLTTMINSIQNNFPKDVYR
jgi:hypothetical protein